MAKINKLIKTKNPSLIALKEKILNSDYIKLKTKEINFKQTNIDKEFAYLAICLDDYKTQENCTKDKCQSKMNGFWNDFYFEDNILIKSIRPCHCLQAKKGNWTSLENISLATFGSAFQNTLIQNLKTPNPTLKTVKKYINKVIMQYPKYVKPIIFIGASGSGKTHILSVIANELYDKDNNIVLVNMKSNLEELFLQDEVKFKVIKNRYKNCRALFIDNFGKEKNTGFARDFFIYEILKYRIQNKKLTFIATEYSIEWINKVYAKNNKQIEANMLVKLMRENYLPIILEKYQNL